MLDQTVTHYAPWDGSDDDRAVCGHPMTAADTHSAAPTCAACGEALEAEDALDAAIAETPLPLDADEARSELDPILNAGLPAAPAARPQPLFADDLFAYAVSLNRAYAGALGGVR